jgi:transglutaminase-like putative cysteine protease
MSTSTSRLQVEYANLEFSRIVALTGTVGLLASFLLVLHDVVGTVGDTFLFYLVVAVVGLAATLLARILRDATAIGVGAVLFVVGLSWHILTLDTELGVLVLISNNIELLTGETVLRIQQVDVWALTVTPAPLFLTWFFALHRRYVAATVVGGSMLTYLVLTGDASTTVTLLGVIGAGVSIGFGELEATEWSSATDQAVVVVAVMVLAPLVVTVVPGGAATPITVLEGQNVRTMESNVVGSETTLTIVGEVNQSPKPRFTVESDQPRLWRTGSYDRYTGEGWVQTGSPASLDERSLADPSSNATALTQRIEAEKPLRVFPAAWQPVSVSGEMTNQVLVGPDGGLTVGGTVPAGTTMEVTSQIPSTTPENLSEAGRNYPQDIREQYTQLPESTPDRVGERTAQITQGTETPYQTAVTIEEWLETNREYSLEVDRPDGNIADAFLFEMDRGYCTYYATTMITMLRSQGIPARMAVGYTPGEPVGDDEYLVRGLNSHAWVEVYFPDVGWVEFDPTPAASREAVEQGAFEGDGGASAGVGVQTPAQPMETPGEPGSRQEPDQPQTASTPELEALPEDAQREGGIEAQGEATTPGPTETDDGFSVPLPSREQLLVVLVGLVGVTAWVRQSGDFGRLSRRLTMRFQRRSDPETDVERAYERLMLLLEDRYRPRETGETLHQYLDDISASYDARQLVKLREQARYGESVTESDADDALDLIERIRKRE